jgi:D-alanine-D-alanine ligase
MTNSYLLFGGSSAERLVSVASAQNIISHKDFAKILFLDKAGAVFEISKGQLLAHPNPFTEEFNVVATAPLAASLSAYLQGSPHAAYFLALHGTEGEDGTIQALLERNGCAFTGSDAAGSKQSFEKDLAKSIAQTAHLRTAPGMVFRPDSSESKKRVFEFLHRHGKIVLKPLANGSSVGLHIVANEAELERACTKIFSSSSPAFSGASNDDYLAEAFLQGRELTVGVIDDGTTLRALPPSEVIMISGRNFDYEGKYLGVGSTEITPADLTVAQTKAAQTLALAAHRVLGCYGYSRTDMMLDQDEVTFIETNTLPGLSKASFIPQQLKCAGISFASFIEQQLELARRRAKA